MGYLLRVKITGLFGDTYSPRIIVPEEGKINHDKELFHAIGGTKPGISSISVGAPGGKVASFLRGEKSQSSTRGFDVN
jgi:hypothetical protein